MKKELTHLDKLESKSIYIIREAYANYKKMGMLWSIGKDSTTMLWLVKKAFFGKVPFPVIYIDTGKHFQEMYDFRDKCVKKWDLDLIVSRNKEADKQKIGPEDKLKCCGMRKTDALKQTLEKHKFDALLLGIRRDEHGVRAKERTFSPRNKDFRWNYKDQAPELWDQYKSQKETEQHLRVHPILHWTEVDIWKYTKRENLPVNPLYFADNNGKRYRSLGCEPCTSPVDSKAKNIDEIIKEVEESTTAERAGRAQDKEEANAMQNLRALGYM
jgi:sulfate adenylyltransferase subunit 2